MNSFSLKISLIFFFAAVVANLVKENLTFVAKKRRKKKYKNLNIHLFVHLIILRMISKFQSYCCVIFTSHSITYYPFVHLISIEACLIIITIETCNTISINGNWMKMMSSALHFCAFQLTERNEECWLLFFFFHLLILLFYFNEKKK